VNAGFGIRVYDADYLLFSTDAFTDISCFSNKQTNERTKQQKDPDVMMPAYNENRLSGIFFVSFMIVSFFYLMNLILAGVVNT
jgi:flagellar biosynthesis protein FliP